MKNRKLKGFYTYEAAVTLPIFVFSALVFLLLFRALSYEWGVIESAYDAAGHMALYGNGSMYGDTDTVGEEGADEEMSVPVNRISLHVNCDARIRKNGVSRKYVKNGLGMLNFAATEVGDRDLDVKITSMMPLLEGKKIFGREGYLLGNRVCVRRWNGFDPAEGDSASGDGEGEIVYVTETGEVYHDSMECTYLTLSIHTIEASGIGSVRSESGHIYHPCEECGSGISGVCYYTDYGERAHSSLTCSKLKRTVIPVSRKEAEETYRHCSKCAMSSHDHEH